jgi:1-phosphatidylinositol phosphodiesterase
MKLIVFTFFILVASTQAHYDPSYFHKVSDGFSVRTDWMAGIPGTVKLTQLAIPGTHNSAAYGNLNDFLYTQCMNFDQQLEYGIRFFDLGVRHFQDRLRLHSGSVYLNKNLNDFLGSVQSFLKEYPTETVLFRIKEESAAAQNTRTLLETFDYHVSGYSNFLKTTNHDITLADSKGKMILFADIGALSGRGIAYSTSDIQDYSVLTGNKDLYNKWEKVKAQLNKAKDGDSGVFYINYFSGVVDSWRVTFFVASGHVAPGTSAARLSTLRLSPPNTSLYPDFPRLLCIGGTCTIFYEGTNILGRNVIKELNKIKQKRTVGIIIGDYFGDDLIYEIVRNNWILKP